MFEFSNTSIYKYPKKKKVGGAFGWRVPLLLNYWKQLRHRRKGEQFRIFNIQWAWPFRVAYLIVSCQSYEFRIRVGKTQFGRLVFNTLESFNIRPFFQELIGIFGNRAEPTPGKTKWNEWVIWWFPAKIGDSKQRSTPNCLDGMHNNLRIWKKGNRNEV